MRVAALALVLAGCPRARTPAGAVAPARLDHLPPALAAQRPLLERLAAPALQLVPGPSPVVARLGGSPVLPSGTRWPSSPAGIMSFVAEVDLAALRRVGGEAAKDLPADGFLALFYDVEELRAGYDPDDRGYFRVVYVPTRTGAVELGAPEGATVFEQRRVGAEVATLLPDVEEAVEGGLPASLREAYADHLADVFRDPPDHHVLGYAAWIQSDARVDAQLVTNGVATADGVHPERARTQALAPGKSEWRLLLQIDTDEDAGFEWGDGGRLYLLIRRADLEASAFDRAWLVLQSG